MQGIVDPVALDDDNLAGDDLTEVEADILRITGVKGVRRRRVTPKNMLNISASTARKMPIPGTDVKSSARISSASMALAQAKRSRMPLPSNSLWIAFR